MRTASIMWVEIAHPAVLFPEFEGFFDPLMGRRPNVVGPSSALACAPLAG